MDRNDRVTVWLERDLRGRYTWHAVVGEVYESLAGLRSPRGEIRTRWQRKIGTGGGPLSNGEMREGRVVRALGNGMVRIRLDETGRRIRAIPEE